jgi:hypothetical protein
MERRLQNMYDRSNECAHGEPRGENYCPFCRQTKAHLINRNVVNINKNAPQTSQAAAAKALPSSGTKRRHIYDMIVASGMFGVCDHEIEQATNWLHQSASAARNSLMNDGLIIDSGMRRKTPQGNDAIAWILA